MRFQARRLSSSPLCSLVTASRDRVLKPSSSSNFFLDALHIRRVLYGTVGAVRLGTSLSSHSYHSVTEPVSRH